MIYEKKTADSLIAEMKKRNFIGHFYEKSSDCVEDILSLLSPGSTISWGGSETIKETGLLSALKDSGKYNLLDRDNCNSAEEKDALLRNSFSADCFLMSSNAITKDGLLFNIDGLGNRVANLIFGPKQVFVIAGMNKIVENLDEAYERVRKIASPKNTARLSKKTPCNLGGKCVQCLSPECICNQVVITRHNGINNRIHVFLINEDLGY